MTSLVGIDLQSVDEVLTSLREFGTRYSDRLFTQDEIDRCTGDEFAVARELATSFAAKEAVLKILVARDEIPSWKEIELRRSSDSRPHLVLSGVAAELARRQGLVRLAVSVSVAAGWAGATVAAETSAAPDEPNASPQ